MFVTTNLTVKLSSQCTTYCAFGIPSSFSVACSPCFYLSPHSHTVPDTQSVWQAAELLLSYWGYHFKLHLMSQIATCRTPKCAAQACVCVCVCVCVHELMLLHPGLWECRRSGSLITHDVPCTAHTITQTHANSSVDHACCLQVSLANKIFNNTTSLLTFDLITSDC